MIIFKTAGVEKAYMPIRGTKKSAGYDFRLPEDIVIHPGKTYTVDSGIKLSLTDEHENYVGLMFIRSSLGIEKHLRVSNSVGVIDADFKDTIKIALHNYGNEPVALHKFEKVVQLVFVPYGFNTQFKDYKEEERTGGVGSTGKF